ncbi:hypothetical protein L486_04877 [Kwoniella mangroviensis CBS 10435]|uniref:Uncharacterized protein n=1 Tax=Kwoniella mangroviensis CBS 10435 TaxID=1331196 RepID=A0A1B9IPB8_9TREE|nr:hypothetical protein L486_04877 [Kwoniella mangroviensis CBS 10435]
MFGKDLSKPSFIDRHSSTSTNRRKISKASILRPNNLSLRERDSELSTLIHQMDELQDKCDQVKNEKDDIQRRSDQQQKEITELKCQLDQAHIRALNNEERLQEKVKIIEEQRDSYKSKYDNLRRITKKRMKFHEEEEKRKAEAEEVERVQNEKKRKLDESFFGCLGD